MDNQKIRSLYNEHTRKTILELDSNFCAHFGKTYTDDYEWVIKCEVCAFYLGLFDIIFPQNDTRTRAELYKELAEQASLELFLSGMPDDLDIHESAKDMMLDRYNDYTLLKQDKNIKVGQFSYSVLDERALNILQNDELGRTMLMFGDFVYFYGILRRRLYFDDIKAFITRPLDQISEDSRFTEFFLTIIDSHIERLDSGEKA